jgi:(1->4)-alpha-D-glucan 1-alpha-D-glucosylmutase
VIAYIRHDGDSWALSVAPRFLTRLVKEGTLPCGLDVWKDTALVLPAGAPARWQEVITGQQVRAGSLLPVGEALKHFPVALLF